jgi:hypothetical protein
MEYFVDTDMVSLDYSEDRELKELPAYRMTLYDKYGHFDSDVFITKEQMEDLLTGFEKIKEKYKNN